MSDRKAAFAKAKELHKKEREDKAAKGSGGNFNFEEINFVALENNRETVVRLLGLPYPFRESGSDVKLINMSMILGDDDKKSRFIWPTKEENPNWILRKVFDKVMAYSWNSAESKKEFKHAVDHPSIFNRVSKNDKPDQTYESGWQPKPVCLWNVIDRADVAWHKENKKTKVLSKKLSMYGPNNDKVWYETGVPNYLYEIIWNNVVEYSGDWLEYDVVLSKTSETPWYKAFHGLDEIKKISVESKPLIVEGPLTPEEESWEKYDFDKLYKVTSYGKIKKKLGVFIQRVDAAFGTKYSTELDELVAAEEAAKPKTEEKPEAPKKEVENKPAAPTTPVVVEEKTPTRKSRPAKTEEVTGIDWNSMSESFEGILKLSDEEKALVTSINDDGTWTFNLDDSDELFECSNCQFESPGAFNSCPNCGHSF